MSMFKKIKGFLSNDSNNPAHGIGIIAGMVLICTAVVYMLRFAAFAFSDDIWYDEVFSINFIERPIGEIISLTALDVHPPFYYIYAKGVANIIRLISPGISLIVAAKLASVLAGMILLAVVIACVSSRYGLLTGGACAFMTVLMPQIANYYLEMRMYALATLLITINILTSLKMLDRSDEAEAHSLFKYFIIMGITGILSSYTQYYAAIAIAGVYIAVLVIAIVDRKRKVRNGIIAIMILSVLFFLPWIGVVFRQMNAINGKYWIQPMTIRSIAGCVKFLFMPITVDSRINMAGAAVLLLFAGIAAVVGIITGSVRRSWRNLLVCIGPLFIVIASGFVLSILSTPIFVYRYMIPASVGLYIAISVILGDIGKSNKWAFIIPLVIMMLIGGCISGQGTIQEESKKLTNAEAAFESIGSIPEDSVVVTNFDHVTAVMSYYLKGPKVYLYDNDCDPLIDIMMPGDGESIDIETMKSMAEEGRNIVFLGSFNSREELVQEFAGEGMNFELESSFLCERYWINKYVLTDGGH